MTILHHMTRRQYRKVDHVGPKGARFFLDPDSWPVCFRQQAS